MDPIAILLHVKLYIYNSILYPIIACCVYRSAVGPTSIRVQIDEFDDAREDLSSSLTTAWSRFKFHLCVST